MCNSSELWQGWVVTAESQERLCRSGLSWVPGPRRIKGGITRQQPHVRVLSPGCCLSHSSFPPWSLRGRIHVCLTYHWWPWLTQWLCVCLPLPPVCLWSNDWLGPHAIVLGESVTKWNICIPFICFSTQRHQSASFFFFFLPKFLILACLTFTNQMEGSQAVFLFFFCSKCCERLMHFQQSLLVCGHLQPSEII